MAGASEPSRLLTCAVVPKQPSGSGVCEELSWLLSIQQCCVPPAFLCLQWAFHHGSPFTLSFFAAFLRCARRKLVTEPGLCSLARVTLPGEEGRDPSLRPALILSGGPPSFPGLKFGSKLAQSLPAGG